MIACPSWRPGAFLALLAIAALAPPAPAQDPRALKALDMWMASYLSGRLDLEKKRINKSSPGVVTGIVPEDRAARIGHLEELDAICRAVAEFANADAMERLLTVASIGYDGSIRLTLEMRPPLVRQTGERWIDRMDSPEAFAALEEYAGNERASKGMSMARRAAALRALGRRKSESAWSYLHKGLQSDAEEVRLAAAEACGDAEIKTLLLPLIEALSKEKDEYVLTAGLTSMLHLVNRYRQAIDEDVLRRTADVAVLALGRGTWRSDLAAVDLLEVVRSAQSVPALIEVLARFEPEGARVDEKLLSGRLKERTHEVLMSLTAAMFPAERADQWRAWWESVKKEFKVAPVRNDAPPGEHRTTTGDFFGIPIRGSRVLFVVDTSGSMADEWRGDGAGTSVGRSGEQKIDVARRELLKAVDKLTADCSFNLVWFSAGSDIWQRDMVPADEKNKKKFARVVEDLRADGGTNLWQGVRDGLDLKSLVYNSRYGENYDQLFVLSDGLPTLGDVQDPKEILLLVKETNRYSRLRIDTVYISGDPEMERRFARQVGMSGSEFMKRLAEENGGISISF